MHIRARGVILNYIYIEIWFLARSKFFISPRDFSCPLSCPLGCPLVVFYFSFRCVPTTLIMIELRTRASKAPPLDHAEILIVYNRTSIGNDRFGSLNQIKFLGGSDAYINI